MRIKLWHIGILAAVAVLFGCAKPDAPPTGRLPASQLTPVAHSPGAPGAAENEEAAAVEATRDQPGGPTESHSASDLRTMRLPMPGMDGGPVLPGLPKHRPQPPRPPQPVHLPLPPRSEPAAAAATTEAPQRPELPQLPTPPAQP